MYECTDLTNGSRFCYARLDLNTDDQNVTAPSAARTGQPHAHRSVARVFPLEGLPLEPSAHPPFIDMVLLAELPLEIPLLACDDPVMHGDQHQW